MSIAKSARMICLVLCIPFAAQAQLESQNPAKVHFPSALKRGFGPAAGFANFLGLNPEKFSMQQSYTLAFTSFGGYGMAQGVYLNTMRYQLSNPLSVSVQWGVLTNLTDTNRISPYQGGFFISGANLAYQPNENFHIGIQYSSYPGPAYYGRGFGNAAYLYPARSAQANR